MAATIVWFRQDLRLQDNPALAAAINRGGAVIPLYILDDAGDGVWKTGGASRWWLHHSLTELDKNLRKRGSRLLLAEGDSEKVLQTVIGQAGATAVYWNQRYEPAIRARDQVVADKLKSSSVETMMFNAALLFDPAGVQKKTGGPFQVFTPFWKHCLSLKIAEPVKLTAKTISAPVRWPAGVKLSDLKLLPKIKWDGGLNEAWQPGETAAQQRMKKFVATKMEGYDDERNFPAQDGTSSLSPHLHFGEISPRQIWSAVQALSRHSGVFPVHRGGMVFLKEVGWREFAYHLLWHFPKTPQHPLREDFAAFPWQKNAQQLRSWQKGLTGYPIVDAGMRQLWHTGWMHNRVRMIVASFLVKHLRHSWQEGAAWFWDTLVDADLANNTLGWQWSAGCGADAAPYFRIFNPILQGVKFDANGAYVRRWVPELAKLPAEFIHQPWNASTEALAAAGIKLGRDYPKPIVDHGEARVAALAALKSIRKTRVV